MAIERQYEMTDGLYTFICAKRQWNKSDYDEALYHVPGQTVRKRWILKQLFPKLKDIVREIAVTPPTLGRPKDADGRAQAIVLSESGLSAAKIAEQLEKSVGTIRKWVRA